MDKRTEDSRPAGNPKHTSSIELLDIELAHADCLFGMGVFHSGHQTFVKFVVAHVRPSAMFEHLPERRTCDVGSLSISSD
jgi:hypothetical protein